jgi:hypothetical protein
MRPTNSNPEEDEAPRPRLQSIVRNNFGSSIRSGLPLNLGGGEPEPEDDLEMT